MRRLPTPLLASLAAFFVLLGVASLAAPAAGQAAARHVDVIEVIGLVDAVQVDFVEGALRRAGEGGAEALVIQVDSSGGVAEPSA